MPTHTIWGVGRVEFNLLDYVNISMALALVGISIWKGSLWFGAVFVTAAAIIVGVTLYGGRMMARLDEWDEDS